MRRQDTSRWLPCNAPLRGSRGSRNGDLALANKGLIIAESELTLLHVNGDDEGTSKWSDPTGLFERMLAVFDHANDTLTPMYVAQAAGLHKP